MEQIEIPLKDRPDSLQDLCICYCMNNLDILTGLLVNGTTDDEDVSSSFSYLLGNKMLDYYTSSCLPSEESRAYIDRLVQNSELCTELSLKRKFVLSTENLEQLANNKIQKLELTCFQDIDSETTAAYILFVEKNMANLNCVKIYQDCEEYVTTGLLNILGGRDYNAETEKVDWRGFGRQWLMKVAEGDVDGMGNLLQKGCNAVAGEKFNPEEDNSNEVEEGAAGDMPSKPFPIQSGAESSCSSDKKTKQIVRHLRSFSYEQLSTSMHPNLEPASSFGWFYLLFSKILEANHDIQSFSLLSLISNPIDWFLSQPHLSALQNLQSLTLSMEHIPFYGTESEVLQIPYTEMFFENLPTLKSLRHLSITYCLTDSYNDDIDGLGLEYTDEQVSAFIEAIKKMPQIKSLDISGTNLHTIIGHQGYTACRDHCMPGFEGRQFEFLGLYDTKACDHKFIPALSVSGNASMEQLVMAMWSLQMNRFLMSKILQEIFNRFEEDQPSTKINLSLMDGYTAYLARFGDWNADNAMTTEEDNILYTLQGLCVLLRNEDMQKIYTTKQKRLLLEKLMVICHVLTACEDWSRNNEYNKNMIVKLVLKLCSVLDNVVTYSYRFQQYIQFLLAIFNSRAKDKQKMLSLHLLHSACRFSQECKEIAGGKMKLVEILLLFVAGYYTTGKECNEMLQKVWSILWTLTDDVAPNCEIFVEKSGCMISRGCIDRYRNVDPLIRKISGAMSNVAENANLRPKLMTQELVDMFRGLLPYCDDSNKNDVSSHAAAYLVMLGSDGPETWTLTDTTRDVVLAEVEQAIMRWKVEVPKGVRFRTLKPILEQIGNHSTPVAQLWGAWVVCNLVIVKPIVYCKMLADENGIKIINEALKQENIREDVASVLHRILNQTLHCLNHPDRDQDL